MPTTKQRRRLLVGGGLTVVLVLAALAWVAISINPVRQYNQAVRRISQKLSDLDQRRPADVSPLVWRESVSWGGTAFVNIGFSESHTPYAEMLRFEHDLDERLAQPVDLGFFEWLWTRLGETGPHGADYVARHKSNWDELVQANRNIGHPRR